jgi:large subunit ribosomal protein L6
MSRLAKKTISVPNGVTVTVAAGAVEVKGPKGNHVLPLLPGVVVAVSRDEAAKETRIAVTPAAAGGEGANAYKANIGTMWSLTRNAVEGSANGFAKTLEIQGVGFKAAMDGSALVLSLGFANPVRFTAPEGVAISVEKNLLKISGHDKHQVGQTASRIRQLKKPEPYKGKGIRYQGEVVRMKAGKKAATAGK